MVIMSNSRIVRTSFRRRFLTTTAVLALALGPVIGTAGTTAASAAGKPAPHASAHHGKKAAPKKAKHPKKKAKKPKVHAKTVTPPRATAPTTVAPKAPTPPKASVPGTVGAAAVTSSFVPEAPIGGVFGTSSFWRQSLVGAPVASNSAAMVAGLATQVTSLYGGVAAFNVWQFNASVYTVDSTVPRIDVKWDNCQGKAGTPTGLLGPTGVFGQVPLPATAMQATGSDSELSIYSPSTDQLWEFWHAYHAANGWHACWGGRIDAVSTNLGYFLSGFGVSATALAASEPVSLNDIRAGVINHAVPIAIPSPADTTRFSWPAQRSDGLDITADAIPEGTRLRLPASVNLDTLGLTPIGRMIAKAAQTYGFIVVDRAGAVAVIAESGNGDAATTGVNPWNALLGGIPAYNQLKNFPWSQLQALPVDWSKPANAPS
ncbi:hypothetical protein acdb102_19060 [Acidothermaceae bacterium B102]|nr:hypothetical protein acdb102_19060 [Acidothermaceae bacterium B102]